MKSKWKIHLLVFWALCFCALAVFANPDTDIVYTYDSGGGKDYSNFATWESDTDDVDFSTDKVMGGISVTSGSFPVHGTVVDDGAGNSGTIYGVKNGSDQALIGAITGTIPTGTALCDAGDTNCFTCTSVDSVGRIIADAYDSQVHDVSATCTGASNSSSSRYRMLRSAAGCSTPWNGTETSGAQFVRTTSATYALSLNEAYFTLYQIGVKLTQARTGNLNTVEAYSGRIISCLVYESANSVGTCRGIYVLGNGVIVYNTIVRDIETDGISFSISGADHAIAANCTVLGCGGYGFVGDSDDTAILWNNYAANNTSGDYQEDSATGIWDALSGWNASKDATADLDGEAGNNYKNSLDLITGGTMNSEGIVSSATNLSASGGAGDNYGRNPYNDVTATYDFSDFFRNDTSGSTMSKEDIQGDSRPNEDVADSAWHVGADQYTATGGPLPQVI